MRARDVAAYGFLSVAWGLSFLVLLHVVKAFGWAGAVSFRALLAAGAMLLIAPFLGRKLDFRAWPAMGVIGATTVAGQLTGLSVSTPRIGTALVAIVAATVPLFAMVFAQLWGVERANGQRLSGLVLGIAGIMLLVGFPAVPVTQDFVIGCAAALAGSLAAAFGSTYAAIRLRDVGAYEVTAGSFVAGGLLMLPLIYFVPVPTTPQPADYAYLAIAGMVMSALSYLVYFTLVTSIGPTRAISVEFVVTAVAVIVGAVILGEPLSALQLAGGAVILLGCGLVLGLVGG